MFSAYFHLISHLSCFCLLLFSLFSLHIMDKAEELEFLKRFIKEVMNLHDNIKQFTDDGTLQQLSEQIGVMPCRLSFIKHMVFNILLCLGKGFIVCTWILLIYLTHLLGYLVSLNLNIIIREPVGFVICSQCPNVHYMYIRHSLLRLKFDA